MHWYRYAGVKFVLISPEELRSTKIILEKMSLEANNIPYQEVERLEDAMPELDVLYMTRVQKERFFNEEDYVRHERFLHTEQTENGACSEGHVSFFIRFRE